MPALQRGLDKAGRTRADIEVTCPGFVAIAESDDQMPKVRAGMRRHLAYYASTPAYRPVLELHGWGGLQTELYACSKRGAWEEMSRLVDDEMLDSLAIIAMPATLASEVARRYGGLVDRITVSCWSKDWWPPVNDALRSI